MYTLRQEGSVYLIDEDGLDVFESPSLDDCLSYANAQRDAARVQRDYRREAVRDAERNLRHSRDNLEDARSLLYQVLDHGRKTP